MRTRWTIQRKLVAGFSVALLILGVLSFLSYMNTESLVETQRKLSLTREILLDLAAIRSLSREAESSQRGFVLTDRPSYLERYIESRDELPEHLRSLEEKIVEHTEHVEGLSRLRSAVFNKIAEMEETIALVRKKRRDAAIEVINSDRGLVAMDQIQDEIESIDRVEQKHRQVLRLQSTDAAWRAPRIFLALAGLECALLCLGYYLVAHDVAERKKSEEALRKSEAFYHSLVESLPQNLFRKDLEGRFTFANGRFCATIGKPLNLIQGKTDSDFFPPELAEKYRTDDARVIDRGEILEEVERHVTPDGEVHYVQVIKFPLYDALGKTLGIQGIFWDVTEQRQAEDRLKTQNERLQQMAQSERMAHAERKEAQSRMVESAKLAGLGQMVAGVAHEINNPLAFVSNNVAVLQRDLRDVREVLELYRTSSDVVREACPETWSQIASISEAADLDYTLANLDGLIARTRDGLIRIQQIVKDLRIFARLDEGDLNEVNLNAGIESTINIIAGHAKEKDVRLVLELEEVPKINGYPAKLNQVFMNLVGNAIDASPEGGSITIRTRSDAASVMVEVEDEGPGIEPEIRDRIFEPFFTTKPVGIGTGLGLSISYGIVQDHLGSIEVESSPGQGTRFLVRLPIDRPATILRPSAVASTISEHVS